MSGFALTCLLCLAWTVPAMAQEANGAGTRSAIPSTRNKPGLRSDAPEKKKEDQQGSSQQDEPGAGEGDAPEEKKEDQQAAEDTSSKD